jgi:hypothetical protein
MEADQAEQNIPDAPATVTLVGEARSKLSRQIKSLFYGLCDTYLNPMVKEEDPDVLALIRETGEESKNEETQEEVVFNTVKYYVQGFEQDMQSEEIDTRIILDEPLNTTVRHSPNSYLLILIFLLHIVRTGSGLWKNDCFPEQIGILEEMVLAQLYTETWNGECFVPWKRFHLFFF